MAETKGAAARKSGMTIDTKLVRQLADVRQVAKGLALVRIGDMHFDYRHLDRLDRVVQRHAGVGVSARVEQHGLRTFGIGLVQPVDQVPFVVRLPHVDLEPELARPVLEHARNVVERVRPIDLRLAEAEQIEVRAVEDVDGIGHAMGIARRAFYARRGVIALLEAGALRRIVESGLPANLRTFRPASQGQVPAERNCGATRDINAAEQSETNWRVVNAKMTSNQRRAPSA